MRKVSLVFGLLMLSAIHSVGAETSTTTVVSKWLQPPVSIAKGEWLVEVEESGGFAYRYNHYIVSANSQFTILSSSPAITSPIDQKLFASISNLVPRTFDVSESTDAASAACMDCLTRAVRVWKVGQDGKNQMLEQRWNEMTHSAKISPALIELYLKVIALKKGVR